LRVFEENPRPAGAIVLAHAEGCSMPPLDKTWPRCHSTRAARRTLPLVKVTAMRRIGYGRRSIPWLFPRTATILGLVGPAGLVCIPTVPQGVKLCPKFHSLELSCTDDGLSSRTNTISQQLKSTQPAPGGLTWNQCARVKRDSSSKSTRSWPKSAMRRRQRPRTSSPYSTSQSNTNSTSRPTSHSTGRPNIL
jgi:hypothetical protein